MSYPLYVTQSCSTAWVFTQAMGCGPATHHQAVTTEQESGGHLLCWCRDGRSETGQYPGPMAGTEAPTAV